MIKKPKLSVIILSYHTKDLLKQCLQSVYQSKGFDKKGIEVIVVDNNSSDGSPEMVSKKFTRAKLIRNKKNVGFAAGNNIGIGQAKGEYLLLLNSDTEVTSDTLSLMNRFIRLKTGIGAATGRLELPDGSLDPACHRGFPTPWTAFCYLVGLEKLFPRSRFFGGYHQGWKDLTRPHEVDVISGAFFMIPRRVVDTIGLLDERFFLYGEDIDWCYRIKQAGYQVMFNPEAAAVHYKKQSGRNKKQDFKNMRKFARYHFIETMEQFYRKHYLKKYPRVINWIVLVGLRVVKVITRV